MHFGATVKSFACIVSKLKDPELEPPLDPHPAKTRTEVKVKEVKIRGLRNLVIRNFFTK
jgi:hypothetical protein